MCVKHAIAKVVRWVLAGLVLATLGLGVQAQTAAWPDKPLKLVVPFPAGGPTDTASRIVGQRLAERLKQPVVVETVRVRRVRLPPRKWPKAQQMATP